MHPLIILMLLQCHITIENEIKHSRFLNPVFLYICKKKSFKAFFFRFKEKQIPASDVVSHCTLRFMVKAEECSRPIGMLFLVYR